MYIPAAVKEYLFGSNFENVQSFIVKNKMCSVTTFHVNSPEKVNRIFTINDLCATEAETDDSFIRCAGKVLLRVHDVAGEYEIGGFVVSESENELKIELVGMVTAERFEIYRRPDMVGRRRDNNNAVGNNNDVAMGNDIANINGDPMVVDFNIIDNVNIDDGDDTGSNVTGEENVADEENIEDAIAILNEEIEENLVVDNRPRVFRDNNTINIPKPQWDRTMNANKGGYILPMNVVLDDPRFQHSVSIISYDPLRFSFSKNTKRLTILLNRMWYTKQFPLRRTRTDFTLRLD